jgi:hypothetical protein
MPGRSFNGNGWVDTQTPYLIEISGTSTLALISNATTAEYFDLVGGVYHPRYFSQLQLAYDSTNHLFKLTDTLGYQVTFDDFSTSLPTLQQGQFESFTAPYGNVMSVISHATDGQIGEMQRSTTSGGNTYTESFLYSYLTSGPNIDLLSGVVLREQVNSGSWTTIRQVVYAYYDGTTSYGNARDLRTATIEDAATNVIDTWYYRYYTGETGGYIGGLKYAFSPASYARLVAAVGDPTTASDASVSAYADNYFEYDSDQRVVTEIVQGLGCTACSGGLGTYTYTYTSSGNSPDFNAWAVKTVETLPDGNQNTVYTNTYGEVMLIDYEDTGTTQHWDTFNKFDSSGRLILTANPSAVTGYDDTYADLLNSVSGNYQFMSDSAGLVQTYDYYTSTTATSSTAGGVSGYYQDTVIQ